MEEKLSWKERRKAKREAKKDYYDKEEIRIQLKLYETEPGTEEYKELQSELKNVNAMRSESKESRRRVSKADKGGIIMKVLGIAGTLGGIIAVAKFEKDGLTYTGEKRTVMDSLVRTAAKFLGRD